MATSSETLPKEPEASLDRDDGAEITLSANNEQKVPSDVTEKVVIDESFFRSSTTSSLARSIFNDERLSFSTGSFIEDALVEVQMFKEAIEKSEVAKKYVSKLQELGAEFSNWEIRVINGSYDVTTHSMPSLEIRGAANDIDVTPNDEETPRPRKAKKVYTPTVANSGQISQLLQRIYYFARTGKMPKAVPQRNSVLSDINLNFKSGKMYLILGAPGSGKSSLLKFISNLLPEGKNHVVGGSLLLNGVSPKDGHFVWRNLVTYVDQIDQHHEYLKVGETLDYAFNCRRGTHAAPYFPKNSRNDAIIAEMDKNHFAVNLCLEAVGLARVKDTFVGNDVSVRGVSGGERRRVTLAELLCTGSPVFCFDEISTGLDAATTFEICRSLHLANALQKQIRIVALLAPPPETVALFDELIMIDDGKIIYSGPTSESLAYFEALVNQKLPTRADPAEWLLTLVGKENFAINNESLQCHSLAEEYASTFRANEKGLIIQETNSASFSDNTNRIVDDPYYTKPYHTFWLKTLRLVIAHEFLLWRRDSRRITARLIQVTVMGLVIGTVFYKQGDDPFSGVGVLFQTLLFLSIGTLPFVITQVDSRVVVYKHQELNFYPTWIFILARFVALLPAIVLDIIIYGTVVFFLSNMAYNDGATLWNFLIFLLLIFFNATATMTFFSIFSAISKDRTTSISLMTLSIMLMVLFSGFTVQPPVIPPYWIWAYWINFFAWSLRGLLINQYGSGKFGETGDLIIQELGFVNRYGQAYQFPWVWWAALFACAISLISLCVNTILFSRIRFRTVASAKQPVDDITIEGISDDQEGMRFQAANLTFTDICYSVKSSDGKETIELLKGVDGYVAAGKMTALMGSSGAGKTTLLDVLALRKTSGEISGEVRVNGHLQDPNSFRRCTGYVEQFDVQSAQLTVKETITFSAKMRLDRSDLAVTDISIQKFVHNIMRVLELLSIQDFVVGSGVGNGLSFEQKKRLSIAVEVASNPSILFLDEPTSGLDANAAAIVIQALKRLADSGRAICATIHQPSVALFNFFDNLLLLKRGGETVYFGDLGFESSKLIKYFESVGTTPKIRSNENPATWMLNVIGGGTNTPGSSAYADYALTYADSQLHRECLEKISEICSQETDSNEIHYPTKYATSFSYQAKHVYSRMFLVYWRSPSYNRTRLIIGALIALLFGSVYASQRLITNEVQLNSICNSMYISVLFLGVNACSTVVTFFEQERNMFYRHKAALMYDHKSLTLASFLAETPFILLVGMIFSVCFYFLLGFEASASKFFLFYFFATAAVAFFTFLGQMLISVFRDAVTAQGFSALFVGMSSLFTGILIAPQNISPVWIWAYWVFPLHYVVEGLLMSQFTGSELRVEASSGGGWYIAMQCTGSPCYGSPSEYLQWRFGGFFAYAHIPWNALYLILTILVFKCIKMVALQKLNYLSK